MKLISTLFENKISRTLAAVLFVLTCKIANSQVTLVCTNPTNVAYGLTSNGAIYEINSTTGATIRTIKNNSYSGNSPKDANGLGYNAFNSKFYYFKRNVTSSPQEFVSFTPATGTVSNLANSTCTDDTHTGCVNAAGTGYYTIDVTGSMHYYNIATNKWTKITSKIVDQNGNNVTNIIQTQNAGDMAIDALGNLWLLTSSSNNYGLYKFPANLPTTAQAQVNVTCWINPTKVTPNGESFRGIAFKPNGQILITSGDDKLYLLQNISTLTFVGNLTTSDVGNDLTACIFPAGILPVTWINFEASSLKNNLVTLDWQVIENENKGFYVQQSTNGSDWEDLGFIAASKDQDPSAVHNYSYSHTNNLGGKQYYRIKQVDIDERISYSEVKTITLKSDNKGVTVFPNPATDHIRILNNGGANLSKAKIFDLSGRIISEKSLQNTNTITVNELPIGTYIVRIEATNGTVYNQKIVKQ